jgi:hypothetical protein
MLELKCAYWMSCSCCYSSEGKVDGSHKAAKVGVKGIAGCMWLTAGYADCNMRSTMALLWLFVPSSGLLAEFLAGCFAGCPFDCPADCPAETSAVASVVVAPEV